MYDESKPAATTGWVDGPRLIEEEYDVEDAVVVGSLLMSLLRHSDRVEIAALAQLVNVIAPIRAEPDQPAWKQTTFFPFSLTARFAKGDVLLTQPRVPTVHSRVLGDVPAADVVATYDAASGELSVFAVNRHADDPMTLRLDLRSFGHVQVLEQIVMGGEDLAASNTAWAPERVAPRRDANTAVTDTGLSMQMPAVSWTLLRLSCQPQAGQSL